MIFVYWYLTIGQVYRSSDVRNKCNYWITGFSFSITLIDQPNIRAKAALFSLVTQAKRCSKSKPNALLITTTKKHPYSSEENMLHKQAAFKKLSNNVGVVPTVTSIFKNQQRLIHIIFAVPTWNQLWRKTTYKQRDANQKEQLSFYLTNKYKERSVYVCHWPVLIMTG